MSHVRLTLQSFPTPRENYNPSPLPRDHGNILASTCLYKDMPENSLGYKHVLVAVCYLSKYVIAHPIRT